MPWRIRLDGKTQQKELTFRFAKQQMRKLQKTAPGTWTVTAPNGREVLKQVTEDTK